MSMHELGSISAIRGGDYSRLEFVVKRSVARLEVIENKTFMYDAADMLLLKIRYGIDCNDRFDDDAWDIYTYYEYDDRNNLIKETGCWDEDIWTVYDYDDYDNMIYKFSSADWTKCHWNYDCGGELLGYISTYTEGPIETVIDWFNKEDLWQLEELENE